MKLKTTPSVELMVMDDYYPRRTLRMRCCQTVALLGSGVGILYGVIQCCAVQVGGEFSAAEEAAAKEKIPCVCIDVNMDTFWRRLGWAVCPTPKNVLDSILRLLVFPRYLLKSLFPSRSNVD